MNNDPITDIKEMVDLLRLRGAGTNEFSLRVPVGYARVVHAALVLRGIETPYPDVGDEVLLELRNEAKVTMLVC